MHSAVPVTAALCAALLTAGLAAGTGVLSPRAGVLDRGERVGLDAVYEAPTPGAEASDCVPHPPIRVTEDRGIQGYAWTNPGTGEREPRPGSGVVAGTGTDDDPYVIAGWCIRAPPATGLLPDEVPDTAAIDLRNTSAHVRIQDNEITGSQLSGGVVVRESSNVTVASNRVTLNWDGVLLWNARHNVVEDNAITDNNGDGVVIFGSSRHNAVLNNTIADSGRDGVFLWGESDRNALHDNTIAGNDLDGVHLWGARDNVVRDNTITFTDGDGVRLDADSDRNLVRDNTVVGHDQRGIDLWSSSDNTVRDNEFAGNDRAGVGLSGSSDDNRFRNNSIHDNEEGVFLSDSDGNAFDGNDIHDNAGPGLRVRDGEAAVQATGNWWGDGTGPGGGVSDGCTEAVADGNGQIIEVDDAAVCFDPWRTEPNPDAGPDG